MVWCRMGTDCVCARHQPHCCRVLGCGNRLNGSIEPFLLVSFVTRTRITHVTTRKGMRCGVAALDCSKMTKTFIPSHPSSSSPPSLRTKHAAESLHREGSERRVQGFGGRGRPYPQQRHCESRAKLHPPLAQCDGACFRVFRLFFAVLGLPDHIM